jgi:hypothetical protein
MVTGHAHEREDAGGAHGHEDGQDVLDRVCHVDDLPARS